MKDHLAPMGVGCHKTFGRADGPIDCRKMVSDHGCPLWQSVAEIIDRDPETGEPIARDRFACVDALQGMFWKDVLRRLAQNTATVDKLTKEVRASNDAGIATGLQGINQQLRQMTHDAQMQIGNGAAHPLLEHRRDD